VAAMSPSSSKLKKLKSSGLAAKLVKFFWGEAYFTDQLEAPKAASTQDPKTPSRLDP
jgi:hypothetical protein